MRATRLTAPAARARSKTLAPAQRLVILAAALIWIVLPAGLMAPEAASAGIWAQATCANPDGSAAPGEGWTSFAVGSPGDGSTAGAGCGPMVAILSTQAPVPVGDSEVLEYLPPGGSRLVGGEVELSAHADGYGNDASGTVVAYTPAMKYDGSDVFFQCAARPSSPVTCPLASASDYSGAVKLPDDRGGDLYLAAGCGGIPGQLCNEGGSDGAWAVVELARAELLLETDATPAASSIEGTLLEGPDRGARSLTVVAKDPGGPGIYRLRVTGDGAVLYEGTPDANDGRCAPAGTFEAATVFDYSQPCKATESVTVSVPTTPLRDGSHDLAIQLEDAAGNTATVEDSQIETDNAPAAITPPSIAGAAVVSSTLSATQATFSAPEGAGPLSAIEGQWLRCSDAAAEQCSAIPGATATAYTPASGDVGYSLVFRSTASDEDGSASSTSAPTVAVSEPVKEVAGAGGQSAPGGQGGAGGSGASAAGAGAGGGAGGSAGTGAGESLTVSLSQSGGGLLGSTAPWQVRLKVKPKVVHKGATIELAGVVSTSPRPRKGVLVYLRARSVTALTRAGRATRRRARRGRRGRGSRRVRHTKWITFAAVRTGSRGRFRATHRFRLGGRNTYQFIAVAPQEGGYLNGTGSSRVVTVREVPRRRGGAGRRGRRRR